MPALVPVVPAVRGIAIFLGVSAFTLSIAAMASTNWLDAWETSTSNHINHSGLFYACWTDGSFPLPSVHELQLQVPYSLTPIHVTSPIEQCCEST